tara:strand:+ start:6436 stop:7563 length:1128 start_codon:yes stop_codon:yes gene_type:complete
MKFTDVNPFTKKQQNQINKSIISTIKKGDFILGNNVRKFEKKFSTMSNSKHAIGCATGTDALILALKSLNLKKKHEVIIPGMSYISTGLAVALNNIKIVFADIDEQTGLISFESIKKKLSKNTKVVIPVNLYGQKIDVKLLRQIVGRRVFIIEDSAQSHFASTCANCEKNDHGLCYKAEKSQKYADLSCYSFYPAKNLGAYGDGGIITTDNTNLYKKIRILRNLGSIKKNVHKYEGLNSRLDTLQASILLEKIKYTPLHNNYRRKISDFYDEELAFLDSIKLTVTDPGSSRHLYVIRTKYRDKLIKFMIKNNISCQLHYPYSLNRAGGLKNKVKSTKLPISEKWAKECLSLPVYPYMKLKDAERVVKTIKRFFNY